MIKVLYNLKIKKLSHLDIKPENILAIQKSEKNYILKLSDFGEARFNQNTLANTIARGTLDYMSPELKLIHS